METLTINGKEIPLQFRFAELLLLGKKWNLKTANEVLNHLVKVSQVAEGEVSFEAMECYADILEINCESKIERNTLMNYLFENPSSLQKLVTGFLESIMIPGESNPEKKDTDEGK